MAAGDAAGDGGVEARLGQAEQSIEWLTNRSYRMEDRVDRLYAQARVFCINSQALEDAWVGMGEGALPAQVAAGGAGEKWLEEVSRALGSLGPFPWSSLGARKRHMVSVRGRFWMVCSRSMRKLWQAIF